MLKVLKKIKIFNFCIKNDRKVTTIPVYKIVNVNLYKKQIFKEIGVLNPCNNIVTNLKYISSSVNDTELKSLNKNEFEIICNETLESLSEYFEELIENWPNLKGSDVTYTDGVLTVQFGNEYGTYVINRQSPNRQIWLSSPTSGPKRYDFNPDKKQWIYRHDNKSLHELLQIELPRIVDGEVNFFQCSYSGE